MLRNIVSALAALAVAVPALAIDNVRNEDWVYDPAIAAAPLTSTVSLSFDATTTENDVFRGLSFSIAATGASPATLVDYSVMGLPNLPDAGQPISFHVVFTLSCDIEGNVVRAEPVEASAHFCLLEHGPQWNPLPHAGSGHGVAAARSFGLTVLADDGTPGANPTPPLHCGDGAAKPAPVRHHPRRTQNGGDNGTIGVYFDRDATMCQGTIQPGMADTVYVLGVLGEATHCGIAGAEFRFGGVPDSWGVFPVPNPEFLVVGDPFGHGVTVASLCQRPASGAVLLYSVLVLAMELETDVEFRIGNREPPSNSLFPCPLLVLCDEPVFTKVCVEGRSCFVNSTVERKCPAEPLPVERATWAGIKQIYR